MQLNDAGIALIKRFEGLRLRSYRDAVGVWTIGYGHTSMAGAPLVSRSMAITELRAEQILIHDLTRFEGTVQKAVKVELNDNQYSALVSFCYNVGGRNFRNSSVLSYVNRRWFDRVPKRLALWNKAGGRVLRGLIRRRQAEGQLFAA